MPLQCSVCRSPATVWTDHCLTCGRPLSLERRTRLHYSVGKNKPWTAAAEVGAVPPVARVTTGLPGMDKVLGGGFAVGKATLLFGPAGRGKTTLLLTALARCGKRALYLSGEQGVGELGQIASRCGFADLPGLLFASTTDVEEAEAITRRSRVAVAVWDSAQVLIDDRTKGGAGSPSQVRALGPHAKAFAAEHDIPLVLVGHTDKDDELAGVNELRHAVDAVFCFNGPTASEFRVLSCDGKNRDGSTTHRAVFRMTDRGIVPADDDDDPYLPKKRASEP